MSTKRIVVLVNDGAGPGGGESNCVQRVDEAFAEAARRSGIGLDLDIRSVDPVDIPDVLVEIWEVEQPDAVAIGGGDGTIGCAAGAAAGADWPLGVLPLGTFNHFAKDIGIPTDLVEAATIVLEGSARPVDVGEVNGRVFVNNSVLGVYPQMVDLRDELRSGKGWGKVRAVPVASLQALRSFQLHRLDLSGPGGFSRRRVRTPFVFVGNGRYQSEGGTPERSTVTDGVLGLTVMRAVSRWGMFKAVLKALVSGTKGSRELDETDLTKVTITSRSRRLRVAVDGEVTWMPVPLVYRVRPGALQVLTGEPMSTELMSTEA